MIGVAQHTDGVYYWTVTTNGQTAWLLDKNGDKLRVTGENGADGQDGKDGTNGITPQLKIDADGYWCVSYDNGTTNTRLVDNNGDHISALGKDGANGDSFFQTVTQDDDYVYFTLVGGEVIKIAKGGTTSEIIYTTVSGNILMPSDLAAFGAEMVSNTYDDGQGVITFDKPLKYIGAYAFYYSDDIKTISLPEGIQQIGLYAFQSCTALTSITIPESVTSIGQQAFYGCTALTTITIPEGVTSIGSFSGCSSLISIIIPEGVTSIGNRAFYGCTSLASINIPNSVTSIGEKAFYGCTGEAIINCNMPDGVYYYSGVFYGSKFTKITIGSGVTSIGSETCRECTSLTSITIPESVISIGDRAFCGCTSLSSVYCKSTKVPTGGESMFDNNVSGRKIYVPTASVAAYKADTRWGRYSSYIVGYNY